VQGIDTLKKKFVLKVEKISNLIFSPKNNIKIEINHTDLTLGYSLTSRHTFFHFKPPGNHFFREKIHDHKKHVLSWQPVHADSQISQFLINDFLSSTLNLLSLIPLSHSLVNSEAQHILFWRLFLPILSLEVSIKEIRPVLSF